MADRLVIVAGVEIGAGLASQCPRARGIAIRDGEEAHRGMLCRKPRPQRADAACADHCNAEIAALHALPRLASPCSTFDGTSRSLKREWPVVDRSLVGSAKPAPLAHSTGRARRRGTQERQFERQLERIP